MHLQFPLAMLVAGADQFPTRSKLLDNEKGLLLESLQTLGVTALPWSLSHTHLQRYLRVKFKLGDEFGPWLKFLGLWVYVIVEDGSLGRKLDCLELGQPPFAELCPVVHKLPKQSRGVSRLLEPKKPGQAVLVSGRRSGQETQYSCLCRSA